MDADFLAIAKTQKWRKNLAKVFLAKLIDPAVEVAQRKEYFENQKVKIDFRKAIGISVIRRFDKISKIEADNQIAELRKKKMAELDKKQADLAI